MEYLQKDIVIIGGGPAGLACAVGACKQASSFGNALPNILIIERNDRLGGILNQCIHDGFGLHKFNEILTGPEYAIRYENQIEKLKIKVMLNAYATDIDEDIVYVNTKDSYIGIKYRAIIFAMGCRERTAYNINIAGNRCSGVYTAGTVQHLNNIDNIKAGSKAVIVGSGDIGLIMARRLTLEGYDVVGVYEILSYPSGLLRNIQQCLHDYNIPLHLNRSVTRIYGCDHIEAVTITDYDDNLNPLGTTQKLECDMLVLAVGLIPEIELAPKSAKLYEGTKSLLVDENNMISTAGMFICGNALHVNDLVDWVSIESEYTGKCAYDYIMSDSTTKCDIKVEALDGVSYVTPNALSGQKDITLAMRVRCPYKNGADIAIIGDDKVIKTKHYERLLSAEMIHIKIKASQINEYKKVGVRVDE